MKPRPVLIEWLDACDWKTESGWVDLAELDTSLCSVVSVGWLINKDDTCYTLALSITEAGDARQVFVIPRGGVQRMVRLDPPRE